MVGIVTEGVIGGGLPLVGVVEFGIAAPTVVTCLDNAAGFDNMDLGAVGALRVDVLGESTPADISTISTSCTSVLILSAGDVVASLTLLASLSSRALLGSVGGRPPALLSG